MKIGVMLTAGMAVLLAGWSAPAWVQVIGGVAAVVSTALSLPQRTRPAAALATGVLVIALAVCGDIGVLSAALCGAFLLAFLMCVDRLGARRPRHPAVPHWLPSLIVAAVCGVAVGLVLVLPVVTGVLVVIGGLAALLGAFGIAIGPRIQGRSSGGHQP
jgi:hypothetical protein